MLSKRFIVLRKPSVLGYIANNGWYLKIFSEKEKSDNVMARSTCCDKGVAAGRDELHGSVFTLRVRVKGHYRVFALRSRPFHARSELCPTAEPAHLSSC